MKCAVPTSAMISCCVALRLLVPAGACFVVVNLALDSDRLHYFGVSLQLRCRRKTTTRDVSECNAANQVALTLLHRYKTRCHSHIARLHGTKSGVIARSEMCSTDIYRFRWTNSGAIARSLRNGNSWLWSEPLKRWRLKVFRFRWTNSGAIARSLRNGNSWLWSEPLKRWRLKVFRFRWTNSGAIARSLRNGNSWLWSEPLKRWRLKIFRFRWTNSGAIARSLRNGNSWLWSEPLKRWRLKVFRFSVAACCVDQADVIV